VSLGGSDNESTAQLSFGNVLASREFACPIHFIPNIPIVCILFKGSFDERVVLESWFSHTENSI